MELRRWITVAGGATALFGMVVLGSPVAWAQDATPEAEAVTPRPVHIHSGNCNELGDVVVPLTDLTAATGERVGQRNRATVAETSFTSVPLTLDAILAEDHAINAHLSAEQIDVYTACGELGGIIGPDGTLVIGLREQNDSGFAGIAFLSPGADGASTDVSVFIAEDSGGRGGASAQAAGESEEMADMDTAGAEGTPAP